MRLHTTDFQVSEGLHRDPEFSRNYLIDYLRDYLIITPLLPHNHRKVNCYWGYNYSNMLFYFMKLHTRKLTGTMVSDILVGV